MIAINRTICILAVAVILTASGCATSGYTAKPLPVIPGTDTSGVSFFVNKEDGSVLLSGQVRKEIDAKAIENFVREEYGYSNISNQITYQ